MSSTLKHHSRAADGAPSPDLEALQKLRIVIRAAQRHSLWVEKQCGVNGAQLWIMQELFEAPGLRVGQITARLAIAQTTTSNLLEGLVRKGYVVKTRDLDDARRELVAPGLRMLADIAQLLQREHHALRRAFVDARSGSHIGQRHAPVLRAEGAEHGQALLQRLVEQWVGVVIHR